MGSQAQDEASHHLSVGSCGAASAQIQTVEDRVESGMNVWATTMAHCRENSGEGDKVDKKKFKACKKCFSGVGDWTNEDGLKRGMACLLGECSLEEYLGEVP